MGRFLIIIVGAAAIFGAISLSSGAGNSALRSAATVADHGERVVVRQIALSGHSVAVDAVKRRVAANPAYTGSESMEGEYQGGFFRSDIEAGSDVVRVTTRSDLAGASYVVRETYLRCPETTQERVPDFMSYAVLVEQDLLFTGTARINSFGGVNANVHTNRDLLGQGTPVVQGFGSYVTGHGNAARLAAILQPVDMAPGAPRFAAADPIVMPPFHAPDYRWMATRVTEGNLELGTVTLGPPTNPVIWYVAGDLIADSGVISGYGIFIVEGNIRINGNVRTAGALCSEQHSSVAFYASGNARVNGGATLRGQIYTEGDIVLNGTATVIGNLATRGNADFSGTFRIDYRSASPTLTEPFWPDDSEVERSYFLVLADYYEGG
jgi:hypothetical protein